MDHVVSFFTNIGRPMTWLWSLCASPKVTPKCSFFRIFGLEYLKASVFCYLADAAQWYNAHLKSLELLVLFMVSLMIFALFVKGLLLQRKKKVVLEKQIGRIYTLLLDKEDLERLDFDMEFLHDKVQKRGCDLLAIKKQIMNYKIFLTLLEDKTKIMEAAFEEYLGHLKTVMENEIGELENSENDSALCS